MKRGLSFSLPFVFLIGVIVVVSVLAGYSFSRSQVSTHGFGSLDEGYGSLGWQLYNAGQYDQAIIEFRTYIRNNENNYFAQTGMGWSLFQKGVYDEALSFLEKAITLQPIDDVSYRGLGWVKNRLSDYQGAITALKEAEKLNPTSYRTFLLLGDSYKNLDATPYYFLYEENNYNEHLDMSIEYYNKAIVLDPERASGYVGLASSYYMKGRGVSPFEAITNGNPYYDKVLEELDKAFLINPDSADGWNTKGYTLYQKSKLFPMSERDYGAITDAFERSLELDPSDWSAWEGKGVAYLADPSSKDNLYAAIESFEEAIQRNPDRAPLQSYIGSAYYHLQTNYNEGGYKRAVDQFNKALELNPKALQSLSGLGWVAVRERRNDDALNFFEQALEIDKEESTSWNGQGFTYFRMGEYDKAEESYKRAIELNPYHGLTVEQFGFLYLYKGQPQQAKQQFTKAIGQLESFDVHGLYGLGMSHYLLGEIEEAKAQFEKALEFSFLDSDESEVRSNLGLVHLKNNDYNKAREQFEKAVTLNNENSRNHLSLAFAEYKLGNMNAAEASLQKTLSLNPSLTRMFGVLEPETASCLQSLSSTDMETIANCMEHLT